MLRSSPFVVAILLIPCTPTLTQGQSATAHPTSIQQASWLSGCWSRTSRGGTTVERWSLPEASGMFGWSRSIRNDSLLSYEFLLLRAAKGQLDYVAHVPLLGQLPTVFTATGVPSPRLLRFENLKHDFPQEIRYDLVTRDSIVATIAGPTPNGRRKYLCRSRAFRVRRCLRDNTGRTRWRSGVFLRCMVSRRPCTRPRGLTQALLHRSDGLRR